MPSSDYTSAVGGGLKLKGAKDAGIDKKKKKKKRTPADSTLHTQSPSKQEDDDGEDTRGQVATENESTGTIANSLGRDGPTAKTDAERKHEEMRRKRLEEKLKRDGFKTHKERVEELNKYLSGLSEHHDMPRIGPG